MRYYFAPMEGLTDSVYRKLHRRYFGGVDRYYMPFFSPTIHKTLSTREKRELPEAEAEEFTAVPQILTRNSDDFLWAARLCRDLGYEEVNLNLGCPSGTVVAKGKGSGMLEDPQKLDCFLYEIFSRDVPKISVKTRLGMDDPEEFPDLLDIFNRYPIAELTVHPRVRKDFYKNSPRMEFFRYAAAHSRNPLCYNGNLCTKEEIRTFKAAFPQVPAVMIGRGLIGDPGLLLPGGTDRDRLIRFHDALLEEYTEIFGSSRNAMFRMKENWRYLLQRFEGSEKLGKRLRKATGIEEYRSITREIFTALPMAPALSPDW